MPTPQTVLTFALVSAGLMVIPGRPTCFCSRTASGTAAGPPWPR
jgi:hypothetical protein